MTQTGARRLAHFMSDHGVTQLEIAAVLGQHSGSVSRKLSGDIPWRLSELRSVRAHLTDRLGRVVSWDELLDPIEAEERLVVGEVRA